MAWEKYRYRPDDQRLAKKIAFYPDLLESAQKHRYESLYSWVTSLYISLQSQAKVGKVIRVTQETMSHWLRNSGFPTRSKGGANNVKGSSFNRSNFKRGNITWDVSHGEEITQFPVHCQID